MDIVNLGTLKNRLIVIGGSLLMIVVFKTYVELRNHLVSLSYSERKHVENVNRLVYRNGEALPRSKTSISRYYDHIPEQDDLRLSPEIIKTAAVNREFKIDSDVDASWMRKVLADDSVGSAFGPNRLLKKFQDAAAAANVSQTECVIRVFQMCRELDEHVIQVLTLNWKRMKCKFSNCWIESKVGNDFQDFLESDVVVFHIDNRDWAPYVQNRPSGQLWVFHSKEASIHGPPASPPKEYGNPFNLSLTYLLESDIAPGYYFVDPELAEPDPKILQKDKLMIWVATNCNSTSWARTRFVEELQNYLSIDTYGRCGQLECPRSEDACWDMRAEYKFTLALENTQCPEYITEKIWKNALAVGSVPIVFGAPKANYERLIPPHSFIHLDDFKTVREFVEYINLLDRDQQKYLEYFSWRRLGGIEKGDSLLTSRAKTNSHSICIIIKGLVMKSLFPERYPWQSSHPVFHDWWYEKCNLESQRTRVMDIDVTM
ncbi:alpha-(1,3)-fucosyltransferase C-like [Lytechinus variegatus]|uniref:alpha-(1,3)-fucosyltransferase C-like n=1 Tax=Lytechinus variegatus TaxID=7654 RepID=UPI001BB2551B|nr:alpha-(1,3)-fucosyltransferase C-like [Lytechinus variegatus]